MADDLFSDNDEWEKVKAWWGAHGKSLVIGIIIAVAIFGGWRWWGHYQEQQFHSSAQLYFRFEQSFTPRSDDNGAAKAVAKNLIDNYPSTPYAAQVSLALASNAVTQDHLDKATSRLQWVVSNASDTSLVKLARLRLARVEIANKQPKQALATLDAEKKAGGFESLYAEVRGDAWFALGKNDKAHKAYQVALKTHTDDMGDISLLKMKLQQTGGVVAKPKATAQS